MKIPSPSLHIQLPFGQKEQHAHPQFGDVQLVSDGRIDDSFKKMSGHQDVSLWRDLGDDRFVSFLEKAGSIVTDTMKQARELFEKGGYADGRTKLRVSHESDYRLRGALANADIPGHVYVTVDPRGVVSQASFSLLESVETHRPSQNLNIVQTPQGAWAELKSKKDQGVHTLRVPFHENGTLNLAGSSESLELTTPWLSKSALAKIGPGGIHLLDDPRLERLADAASSGSLLEPKAMGPGWEYIHGPDFQVWTTSGQQLVLDQKQSLFHLTSTSWETRLVGPDCAVGFETAERVQWREGKMEKLRVAKKDA